MTEEKRKRATKEELRNRSEVVGSLVNNGVPLKKAVRMQAREEGVQLTNTQVVNRANNMRSLSHYREVINEKKDKMEMRLLDILNNIDGDIITHLEQCSMPEKIDIMKALQSRLGIFNREGGITLNVAVLGDDNGSKRRMNFNPNPGEWAWDTAMECYIHLPTAQAVEKQLETSFKRHPSCEDRCQMVVAESDTFSEKD